MLSLRSTWLCFTCVKDTVRNTLQKDYTKSCIGSSSRRGFFSVAVYVYAHTGLTGPGSVSRVKGLNFKKSLFTP